MNQLLEEKYKELGISEKVYAFGEKIEQELKERFEKIDANAEYNQMKVIAAMQKNRVSAECFNISSGYGYNDMGRDTLERVYADCFGGEDALVRPQITCGTHALALALMSNLRPGDELLSPQLFQGRALLDCGGLPRGRGVGPLEKGQFHVGTILSVWNELHRPLL